MKSIIKGRKYDTETAVLQGEYEYSCRTEFKWYREELYRKRNGEFFIFGEGNAKSRYAEKNELMGMWGPGSSIVPLSYEDARSWAEEYLSVEEYEEIFGEVSDAPEMTPLMLSLPAGAIEKLRREAGRKGKTMSEIVNSFISGLPG